MKTTIDVSDALLRRAKRLAARRGTTLRAIVDEALEILLEQESKGGAYPPVRTHVVGGNGLQRGLTWSDWDTLRALAYEGRGG